MKFTLGRNHTPLRVAFARRLFGVLPIPGKIRGQVLCFVAVIIGFKGAGYIFNASSASTDQAMNLLTQYVAMPAVGGIMVVICAFAWFSSYCHHGRDRYGYDALTGMAFAFSGIYLVSAAEGPFFGVQGFLTWLVIGVLLIFLRRIRDVRDEPSWSDL